VRNSGHTVVVCHKPAVLQLVVYTGGGRCPIVSYPLGVRSVALGVSDNNAFLFGRRLTGFQAFRRRITSKRASSPCVTTADGVTCNTWARLSSHVCNTFHCCHECTPTLCTDSGFILQISLRSALTMQNRSTAAFVRLTNRGKDCLVHFGNK